MNPWFDICCFILDSLLCKMIFSNDLFQCIGQLKDIFLYLSNWNLVDIVLFFYWTARLHPAQIASTQRHGQPALIICWHITMNEFVFILLRWYVRNKTNQTKWDMFSIYFLLLVLDICLDNSASWSLSPPWARSMEDSGTLGQKQRQ